eukprot:TRINITY_DN54730_c0_g1_i1.p1 TRINITY_DN54730_c0_g1~~TRINITY_DN54730_c0_g1_i1.p1  ORF type:complete len:1373 (-),score=174.25 TRINITY_DN54730_c0_g1_i1:15-4133(-)
MFRSAADVDNGGHDERRRDVAVDCCVQIVTSAVAVSFCVAYNTLLISMTKRPIHANDATLWFVLCSLVLLLVLLTMEVLMCAYVQVGPLCELTTWKHMLMPHYHKLEALCLCVIVIRVVWATVLIAQVIEHEQKLDTRTRSQEQATILSVMYWRAARVWGVYYGVSVNATKRYRQELSHPVTKWWEDHISEKTENNNKLPVRLQLLFDRIYVQMILLSCVLLHCWIYFATRGYQVAKMTGVSEITKYTGYGLLFIFFIEFFIRCIAQNGERFLRPMLHKAEVFFLAVGMALLSYTTWYHDSFNSWEGPSSLGIATALIANRFLRVLGIRFEVSASEFHAAEVWDAQMARSIDSKFGGILLVPPQNVHLKIQDIVDVRIEKAKLDPDALRELHLPFQVDGGFIKEMAFTMKGPMNAMNAWHRRTRKTKNEATVVNIDTMLLVLAPGPGLVDVSSDVSGGGYWNYRTVMEAKSKLVDIILSHLTMLPMSPDTAAQDTPVDSKPSVRNTVVGRASLATQRAKKRLKTAARDIYLQHVEVKVKRLDVHFEDFDQVLGNGHISVGMSIGKATVSREAGKSLTAKLSRFQVYVQTPQIQHPTLCRNSGRMGKAKLLECSSRGHEKYVRGHNAAFWRMLGDSVISQGRFMTDRQQHILDEKRPEYVNIFSFLNVNSHAYRGPDTIGSGDSHWRGSLTSRPLKITVDDKQVRCLRSISKAVNAWMLHNNAFRWRPGISMADASAAVGTGVWNKPLLRILAKQWWLYAFYRVLAVLKYKPRVSLEDAKNYSFHRKRHWKILSEVASRVSQLNNTRARRIERVTEASNVPIVAGLLQPDLVERQELMELQTRLPYLEIVKDWQRAWVEVTRSHMRSAKNETRSVTAREEFEDVGSSLEKQEFLSKLGTQDAGSSSSLGARETFRRCVRLIKAGNYFLKQQDIRDVDVVKACDNTDDRIQEFITSTWEAKVPMIDVRVLCWGERPRPVLLHAKIIDILVDASVQPEDDMNSVSRTPSVTSSKSAIAAGVYSCNVIVDTFCVRSPEAPILGLAEVRQVCIVTKYLKVKMPPYPLMTGSRIGKRAAFVCRMSRPAGKRLVTLQVCLPNLRVLMFDPLIHVLKAFVRDESVAGVIDFERKMRNPSNGLIGVSSKEWNFEETLAVGKQFIIPEAKTNSPTSKETRQIQENLGFLERKQKVYEERVRRLEAVSRTRLFEFLAGIKGEQSDLVVHIDAGAFHATKVCRYTFDSSLLHDYKVDPSFTQIDRGAAKATSERMTIRLQASDASFPQASDRSGLLAWDSKQWNEIDSSGAASRNDPFSRRMVQPVHIVKSTSGATLTGEIELEEEPLAVVEYSERVIARKGVTGAIFQTEAMKLWNKCRIVHL